MIFLFRGWERVFCRVFLSDRPFEPSHPLPPRLPLASLHFYRINEFSSCAPVFPGKRRREGGGERLLLRHKGCDCENVCFAFRRLPPETRRGGLASSFAQKRPHCFSWRKQCISRISRLAFKDGEGGKWGKRKERSGGGGGRKKDAEKRWREEERGEKKLLARQRCASTALCTRTRLIVPKERIFTERFRAVAKEIRR